TLARVALGGGTPRQVLEDVLGADWSPDGSGLAVLRGQEGKLALEYPIGKRLYAGNDLALPRVSPDGKKVAVVKGDGGIVLFATSGHGTELVKNWLYIDSVAWHPSGREVWFAGIDSNAGMGIYAADFAGHVRRVAPTTDLEILHDIASNSDVLIEREINTW